MASEFQNVQKSEHLIFSLLDLSQRSRRIFHPFSDLSLENRGRNDYLMNRKCLAHKSKTRKKIDFVSQRFFEALHTII